MTSDTKRSSSYAYEVFCAASWKGGVERPMYIYDIVEVLHTNPHIPYLSPLYLEPGCPYHVTFEDSSILMRTEGGKWVVLVDEC